MGEFFGTTRAAAAAGAVRAPTIVTFSPPDAANTGGASPTPPMSTEPEPMACSIGGPEVKSVQLALNGSLLISPAACSSASAPVPFWSPMVSVTDETFTVEPEALDDDGELPDERRAAGRRGAGGGGEYGRGPGDGEHGAATSGPDSPDGIDHDEGNPRSLRGKRSGNV